MNKKVIIIISIILVLIGGIVGFIIFDSINKKNNKVETTTTTIPTTQKKEEEWEEVYSEGALPIYFKCLNEKAEKECVLNKEGIKISIKKELPTPNSTQTVNLLYINDIKSNFISELVIESHFNIIHAEKVDNDTVYIIIESFDGNNFYLIDKTGQKITDFSNVSSLNGVNNVEYKEGKFILSSIRYLADYEASLCRDYNDNDYAYINEEFEYLGNGNFSQGTTTLTRTVDEIIREIYGMSCAELKVSTDPALEYARSLANGQM